MAHLPVGLARLWPGFFFWLAPLGTMLYGPNNSISVGQYIMKQPVLRAYILGFLVPFSAGLILAASSVHNPSLGAWAHITRALDSFALHLLSLALICAFAVFILRARWIGSLLIALILVVAAPVIQNHLATTQTLAADKQPNLRILWFNMLGDNKTPALSIVESALSEQADVIVFTESTQLKSQQDLFAELYPNQLGCIEVCEILAFSKLTMADKSLETIGASYNERLGVFNVSPLGGQTVSITTAHLSKPWYLGFAEREDHRLDMHLQKQSGPQVLIGDFNAAPWSQRINRRLTRSGLKGLRIPVSTWPVSLGAFGIPIDQVFVGGGVQVVSVDQWGHDLGSNHLGLLVDLYVPPAQTQ